MNTKVIIIVLAVLAAGLGITLFVIKNQDDQRHSDDVATALSLSNNLATTSSDLDAEKQVNLSLTNDLAQARQQGLDFSNTLAATKQQLEQQTAATQTAEDSLAAARSKISGLNKQVSDLQADNNALDQRATELANTIATLNAQIKDIQTQLADTRTDKAFLEKQLAELSAQKADLEHKFNDLNTVRAQYKKLKTEAFIENHIQLRRETEAYDGKKLGQIQMERPRTGNNQTSTRTPHYDLNVEVGSDGSVHVIPPVTNTAAH